MAKDVEGTATINDRHETARLDALELQFAAVVTHLRLKVVHEGDRITVTGPSGVVTTAEPYTPETN